MYKLFDTGVKRPTRNKFGSHKTELDGITFDSAKEARRWAELQLLRRAGEITSEIERQVSFELIPKQNGERACTYLADFRYTLKTGEVVVEDVKGHRTEVYRIKRKLMLFVHGVRVVES